MEFAISIGEKNYHRANGGGNIAYNKHGRLEERMSVISKCPIRKML